MHPILFEAGPVTIYTYGAFIALGAILGLAYMAGQGKKRFGTSYDQTNSLFIYIVLAAYLGGKAFFFFEDPAYYAAHLAKLFGGNGFVFFGSLLFAIPAMLWFFKKHGIPALPMLDVMAIVACMVHGFGRLGCFIAGCCYGKPTDGVFGVVFSNPACLAKPLGTPLHPTQLYESGFIFSLMAFLAWLKKRKQFDGQLFLTYLIVYSAGRGLLETLRGDGERGFIIQNIISHSQFISLLVILASVFFYVKLKGKGKLLHLN